jgi:hypothetical protein
MKKWIVSKVAGPLGFVVRPVLAGIIGTLVAIGYEQAGVLVAKIGWLEWFVMRVVVDMPPAVVEQLTPKNVGIVVAGALWVAGSDWVILKLKGGVKELQLEYNAAPGTGSVKVDGIALPGGETVRAVGEVLKLADPQNVAAKARAIGMEGVPGK